ncbi:LysR family transcriptional regulator [Bacillus sp. FJAT-42376]|uniref:LysR family transcriptional regulator n=1 Tax=Bacillus sp. FJAT-42376 TaxID=2014076 RepID=UPI000F4E8527|nr:LysR family transcriptional regulator [Bacillus sp. FJAT-42376]AZB41995.1 LysR family transcriptional regulator [Bacillus sp. FJAT-42376]
MELRQLKYFVEAVRQKNFTRAAENMLVSQPALSKMIKSLEDELGVPLIIRNYKGLELTDAGHSVYRHAVQMIGIEKDIISSVEDVQGLSKGTIKIGIPPIIGSLFFPKVLAAFHTAHPNIRIQITEFGAKKVTASVLAGDIEMGVAVLPVDEKNFHAYPIVEEELVLVVNEHHPLASSSEVQLSQLSNENFIFYSEDFALYEQVREFCINAGFEPAILFQSSQWDFMSEMAAAGLGVTILPQSICRRITSTRVRKIPIQKPSIPWSLAIIIAKDTYTTFAGRAFIEFIMGMKDRLRMRE